MQKNGIGNSALDRIVCGMCDAELKLLPCHHHSGLDRIASAGGGCMRNNPLAEKS